MFREFWQLRKSGRKLPNKKKYVQLNPTNREYLEALIHKGELKAKTFRRVLALLELDRGQLLGGSTDHQHDHSSFINFGSAV